MKCLQELLFQLKTSHCALVKLRCWNDINLQYGRSELMICVIGLYTFCYAKWWQVRCLENENDLLESQQKELKGTINSILESRESFIKAYEVLSLFNSFSILNLPFDDFIQLWIIIILLFWGFFLLHFCHIYWSAGFHMWNETGYWSQR